MDAGEYLDVGDRTTRCFFCDAPLWELEVQDVTAETGPAWSVDKQSWVVEKLFFVF